jgi:hypothetical protein
LQLEVLFTGWQHEDAVFRMLQGFRVHLAHNLAVHAAAQMSNPDRTAVNHDRDHSRPDPPGVRNTTIQNLFDTLNLDEMIAATDAADLRISREFIFSSKKIV